MPRWSYSVVQSQMTKTDPLAKWSGRHHDADLDLTVGDDHPVDQEFDERTSLLERGVGQSLPYPGARRPNGTGQSGEFSLSGTMGLQLPCLLFQLMLTSFEISFTPSVFTDEHDAGKTGFRQALDLLCQAHLNAP